MVWRYPGNTSEGTPFLFLERQVFHSLTHSSLLSLLSKIKLKMNYELNDKNNQS